MCAKHASVVSGWEDVQENRQCARERGETGLDKHNKVESFASWRDGVFVCFSPYPRI